MPDGGRVRSVGSPQNLVHRVIDQAKDVQYESSSTKASPLPLLREPGHACLRGSEEGLPRRELQHELASFAQPLARFLPPPMATQGIFVPAPYQPWVIPREDAPFRFSGFPLVRPCSASRKPRALTVPYNVRTSLWAKVYRWGQRSWRNQMGWECRFPGGMR